LRNFRPWTARFAIRGEIILHKVGYVKVKKDRDQETVLGLDAASMPALAEGFAMVLCWTLPPKSEHHAPHALPLQLSPIQLTLNVTP
jgi:hypothetical protein